MADKVVVVKTANRSYCSRTARLKPVNSGAFQGFEMRCMQVINRFRESGGGHQPSKRLFLFLLCWNYRNWVFHFLRAWLLFLTSGLFPVYFKSLICLNSVGASVLDSQCVILETFFCFLRRKILREFKEQLQKVTF